MRLHPAAVLLTLLRDDQHFSHTTAASIWGMPVDDDGLIHVTTRGDGPVARRRGVVGHRCRVDEARVAFVRGLPVSDELDAWAECATSATVDELVVAGDYLVRTPDGHSLDELEAVVERRRGRRGARALRAALAEIRVGAESPQETRLRRKLPGEGVRMPLLNCSIHDRQNRFVARPDMTFGRERVCVEYDGDHHRTNRKAFRDDKRRREALADAGWHTLYLSGDDLYGANWRAFVERLKRALERGEQAALARERLAHDP